MIRRSLKIKDSITGESNLLVSTGHYRLLREIRPSDYLINKDGQKVKVKEIRYAGKKQLINIHSEAWNTPITVSEDQKIIADDSNHIILPSSKIIQWDKTNNTSIDYTFEYGFVLGLLIFGGMISDKNIILLIRTDANLSLIKKVNRCLSNIICIKDIEIAEGSCIIKYIIDKQSIPKPILDILMTKTIPDEIYNPCKTTYIDGIKQGIACALEISDRLDKPYIKDYMMMLCNWINLTYSQNNDNKHIKFFLEKFSLHDRVWNIILENPHDTFIVNNIACVSSYIE